MSIDDWTTAEARTVWDRDGQRPEWREGKRRLAWWAEGKAFVIEHIFDDGESLGGGYADVASALALLRDDSRARLEREGVVIGACGGTYLVTAYERWLDEDGQWKPGLWSYRFPDYDKALIQARMAMEMI